MSNKNGIVGDGHERARRAVEPEIRAAVHAEFAEQLAKAGFLARVALKRRMEREIERRIVEQAPPAALY